MGYLVSIRGGEPKEVLTELLGILPDATSPDVGKTKCSIVTEENLETVHRALWRMHKKLPLIKCEIRFNDTAEFAESMPGPENVALWLCELCPWVPQNHDIHLAEVKSLLDFVERRWKSFSLALSPTRHSVHGPRIELKVFPKVLAPIPETLESWIRQIGFPGAAARILESAGYSLDEHCFLHEPTSVPRWLMETGGIGDGLFAEYFIPNGRFPSDLFNQFLSLFYPGFFAG